MILTKKQKNQIIRNTIQTLIYLSLVLLFVLLFNGFNCKKRHKRQHNINKEFSYLFIINSTEIDVNWEYSIKNKYNHKNKRKHIRGDNDINIIYNYLEQFTIDEIKILDRNITIKIPRYNYDTIIITNIKYISKN